MNDSEHISILGGGPAGLSSGFFARRKGLPFTVYEAADRVGGNSITLRCGDFLFDSGAHRIHGNHAAALRTIRELIGNGLHKIDVQSRIYHEGTFVNFPLSPVNLLSFMGFFRFSRAVVEVFRRRFFEKPDDGESFEGYACQRYGRTLADLFLLNYSQKLWGEPCGNLSSHIAGERLNELNLRTFLKEALFSRKRQARHFEGAFYYPDRGIGTLIDKLAGECGEENIRLNSRVTRIRHDNDTIRSIVINAEENVPVRHVYSTLPITRFLRIMDPAPPRSILDHTLGLRYRNILCVAFFLDKPSVTEFATIYFPDPRYPFTRISEPINRNRHMAPPGMTSLVVEIPCWSEDALWGAGDDHLVESLGATLFEIGWLKRDEIVGTHVHRMKAAYPVLHLGYERKIARLREYLDGFSNLKISGRAGDFQYSWIHDMIESGREYIQGRS